MSGFDFWRPPLAELPSDEEGEGAQEMPAPVPEAAPIFAPPPRRRAAEPLAVTLTLDAQRGRPSTSTSPTDLSCLELDDAAVSAAGLPVRLASFPQYLRSLTLAEDQAFHQLYSVHSWPQSSSLPQSLAQRRLEQVFGPDTLPRMAEECHHPPGRSHWSLEVDGVEVDLATPASQASSQACDANLCGALRDVPPLPNPFTLTTDCPVMLGEILQDIPQEDWDSKRFMEPMQVEGMPGLLHGPGGLLSPLTPRQLAHNLLAAALVNRLCANLMISIKRVCEDYAAEKRVPPEELAVLRARGTLKEAEEALRSAQQEASEAQESLRTFLQSGELDADRQRHLQAVVGWKTSAAEQSARELQEAQEALKLAELARAEAAVAPSLSWTQKWSTIAPPQAEGEVFAIRLAETGQLLYSLWDFIDAMQHGLVDRTRGSYVPKHALEVAFVRSAADHLLLCTQDEKGFVHLPAPRTVSTGLSLEALWPLHGLALRLEGQTFPFSLHLTAADQRPLQFRGMGLHAISYQTPWNPLEYGDVLWASEAQDTLLFLPLLMVLSELVLDPHLSLGPFEPLGPLGHSSHGAAMQSNTRLPLASASLAVLQAELFHDVKMWPVALPPPARARYDFALRYLKLACQKVEEEHSSGRSPRLPGAEALRPEIVTRSLEALEKVPDDGDGSGGTPARGVLNTACSGFADRVKRMELSALSVPLKGCIVVRNAVEELLVLWPKFLAN